MLATSTAGARTGKSPTFVSRVISGRPETQTATSVDVPPMSKVRMRSKPACDGDERRAADAARGAREHGLHGVLAGRLEAHQPAVGADDLERRAGPRRRRARRGRSSGTSRAPARRTRSSASSPCARTRGTRGGSRTRSRPAGRARPRRRSRRSRARGARSRARSAGRPSAPRRRRRRAPRPPRAPPPRRSARRSTPSAPIRSGTSRT